MCPGRDKVLLRATLAIFKPLNHSILPVVPFACVCPPQVRKLPLRATLEHVRARNVGRQAYKAILLKSIRRFLGWCNGILNIFKKPSFYRTI